MVASLLAVYTKDLRVCQFGNTHMPVLAQVYLSNIQLLNIKIYSCFYHDLNTLHGILHLGHYYILCMECTDHRRHQWIW